MMFSQKHIVSCDRASSLLLGKVYKVNGGWDFCSDMVNSSAIIMALLADDSKSVS